VGRSGAVAIGHDITTAANDDTFSCIHRVAAVGNAANFTGDELVDSGSSRRFKRNIQPYHPNLDLFHMIRPVIYQAKLGHGFDDFPDVQSPGLIAEELEEVYPEFVLYQHSDKKDKTSPVVPISIAYDKMIALLVAQLQALKNRIEILESSSLD
jgi:hypothetical protein